MSGDRPDDLAFHLRFQAEILDQVARIAATLDGREKARRQAAELRMRAGYLDGEQNPLVPGAKRTSALGAPGR